MKGYRRFIEYIKLARLEKPEGWLLLLWPTLWAVWLANPQPDFEVIALFIGGVIVTRSFGCGINDIADRKLDAKVARTKHRPLAAKTISLGEAIAVSLFFLLLAFGFWLQLTTSAKIWALGALVIASSYPLAKRFIALPQAHLGIAFSFGIPIAFVHITGEIAASTWLLFVANWFYTLAYDTIYAMVDRDDDIAVGIKSSAITLGNNDILGVAASYYAMLACLIFYCVITDATLPLYIACGLGFGMVTRFIKLIRSRQPDHCFLAFRLNHWLGALIWLGIVAQSRLG